MNEDWVKKALSDLSPLEKEISNKFGISIKLKVVENNSRYVKLSTQDFSNTLPKILSPLFKHITIKVVLSQTNEGLYGSLNYEYEHSRGSNGYRFGDVYYELKSNKWIVR